ncbi:hypothetical protein P3W45_001486 [Vairimorpha bombi]|jgi:hypothetical protein
MLTINNMCIYIDEDVICTNKSIRVSGICGVVGRYNQLRECFISEITGSLSKYIPGISVRMNIEINDEEISYNKFKTLRNIYTLFHSKDTVEDILYFVNRKLADSIIEDFILKDYRKCLVGRLSPALSNVLEMAVGVCSQMKIIYCYENLNPYKSTEFYIRQIRKYCNMRDTVVFVESHLFDKNIFDSYLVIEDDTFDSFIIEKDDKISLEHFKYKAYISRFDISQIVYKGEGSDDLSSEKSICGSSSEAMLPKQSTQKKNFNILVFLKELFIYKKETILLLYKCLKFFIPDISKALILTNSKLNRPSISEKIKIFYKNTGNVTIMLFIAKHWYSLHLIVLFLVSCSIYYSLTTNTSLVKIDSLLFKSLGLKKYESIVEFGTSVIKFFIFLISVKYLRYLEADTFLKIIKIFLKEYLVQSSLIFYKLASSVVYFLVLYTSSCYINQDYIFISKYLNIAFNSSTYYVHLIMYTFVASILPLILTSFLLNIRYLYVFALNGLFLTPLLNLFRHNKSKVLIIAYIVTVNLVYPVVGENLYRNFFTQFMDLFEPFNLCRNLYYKGIEYIVIAKLVFMWFIVFLIYCMSL